MIWKWRRLSNTVWNGSQARWLTSDSPALVRLEASRRDRTSPWLQTRGQTHYGATGLPSHNVRYPTTGEIQSLHCFALGLAVSLSHNTSGQAVGPGSSQIPSVAV